MRIPLFHVDAFTTRRFAGNPAAVMIFPRYPDDALLQAIAAENNLPETAFLVPAGPDWQLRWFTPTVEVPLCGHATLASSWVVLERLERERTEVRFLSRESGALHVRRQGGGFVMDFPSNPPAPIAAPPALLAALGAVPTEVLGANDFYLAVMPSAAAVRALAPDLAALARLDRAGVIVTAPGDDGYDCVSRFFTPAHGIPEDPVTGGAHCTLAPYWSARLGKREIRAFQASRRGGSLVCRANGDRVELEGACALYLEGHVELD